MVKKSQMITFMSMVGAMLISDVHALTEYVIPASASSVLFRQKILKQCRDDIYHFLNHENGQIAIYDAVNPLASGRRSLAEAFAKHDVQVELLVFSLPARLIYGIKFYSKTLFIESACDDERIIEENVRNVKISSPDVGRENFCIGKFRLIVEVCRMVSR